MPDEQSKQVWSSPPAYLHTKSLTPGHNEVISACSMPGTLPVRKLRMATGRVESVCVVGTSAMPPEQHRASADGWADSVAHNQAVLDCMHANRTAHLEPLRDVAIKQPVHKLAAAPVVGAATPAQHLVHPQAGNEACAAVQMGACRHRAMGDNRMVKGSGKQYGRAAVGLRGQPSRSEGRICPTGARCY